MRTKHLSKATLIAGLLSIAVGGCSNDNVGPAGSGGTTSAGSGGTTASGGTTSAGGSGSGGITGSGGTTAQPGTGGRTGSGGATATGGSQATGGTADGTGGQVAGAGGRSGTGGRTGGTQGTGGLPPTGGTVSTGGNAGGSSGGTGGRTGTGGRGTGGVANGGAGGTGAVTGTGGTSGGRGGSTGTSTGPCTPSKDAGRSVTGSGPHKVVMESNSDPGINCGTIYRPSDLGGAEKYPIFVWGEGACTRSGTSNQASMAEIASQGYFVVADGPPSSGGTNCGSIGMSDSTAAKAKPLLDYITWAIAENEKSCSAYYQSLDPTKVAADGFSCGGLMAESTVGDPRMTAVGITSSGLTSADQNLYKSIHTPFKILLGGSGDQAYSNGMRDYQQISALGIPVLLLSKNNAGHGGDLSNGKGDFNTVNLAWLNWQLKGDEGATGKALLIGSSCKYCNASGWEFKSANIP